MGGVGGCWVRGGGVRVDVKSLYEDRQHIYIIMSSFFFAWQLVAMDTSTALIKQPYLSTFWVKFDKTCFAERPDV